MRVLTVSAVSFVVTVAQPPPSGAPPPPPVAGDGSQLSMPMALPICTVAPTYPPVQFTQDPSSQEHCDRVGLPELQPYRQGMFGPASFFPFLGSVSLTERNPQITHAVLWTHGAFANPNKYFCDGIAAARDKGADHTTVTIAPWFSNQTMAASTWQPAWATEGRMSTCWNSTTWLQGADSWLQQGDRHSASYAWLDGIVELLQDKQNFPNLKQVAMTGFSAGCQMLSRWAFFSKAAKDVRVIVGDGAAYLYFDELRPAPCCSPLINTGRHHTCQHFAKPNETACPDFNVWKNGLSVPRLVGMSYIAEWVSQPDKLEELFVDFPQKDVRFMMGDADVCQCNVANYSNEAHCFIQGKVCVPSLTPGCCDTYPDSDVSNAIDFVCGATLQGSNRLQRGLNYVAYLTHFFGKRGVTLTPPVTFFTGGHDNTAWASSPEFAHWAGWPTRPTVLVS